MTVNTSLLVPSVCLTLEAPGFMKTDLQKAKQETGEPQYFGLDIESFQTRFSPVVHTSF